MFLKKVSYVYYANQFDTDDRAWVPEIWAAETLAILEENMVIGNLVHTDFEDEVANFGDVVNTRQPGEFDAERKGTNDDVTIQDATATRVAVKLDQHLHTSFLIRDGEESKSFQDLVQEYLRPAAKSLATAIDQILLGQVYQFLANAIGNLGSFTSSNAKATILDTRQKMNENKAFMIGRNLVLTPSTETETLKLDLFISADKIGDEGTAMREASLGRKLGFDFFMSQNTPSVIANSSTQRTLNADELSADEDKGQTVLSLDAGTVVVEGEYMTLETDEQPLRVVSIATNDVTVNRPLRSKVVSGTSDLFAYHGGLIDLVGHVGVTAYPAGYSKRIKVDTGASPRDNATPLVGQLVSFRDVSGSVNIAGEYSIIRVITDGSDKFILLDRPLDIALEDNDEAWFGPTGDFNFAFHRNALALVTRPLAQPKTGTGALSGVTNFNGLSIRVTITYDGTKQGHLVTLDLLAGVKVLDTALGAPMLG